MQVVQPIIVKTIAQPPARELGIGDVIIQALGLSGGLLIASLVLGFAAGVVFIWFRRRQGRSRVAGEAGDQIRLRLEAPVRDRVGRIPTGVARG
jgi:hypothetical protein